MVDKVTLSIDQYNRLTEDAFKLQFLLAHGVDNWEGYDEALREMYEALDEET